MRVYFDKTIINVAHWHSYQTGLQFCSRFAVYFTLFLLLCEGVYAQNSYKITGKVIDKDEQPVEFASVVLSNNVTKKLTGTTSGADGAFALNAKAGAYILEVSLLGYEKYTLNLTVENSLNIGSIILKEEINTLKEAKIVANRVDYNMSGYEYKIGNIASLKNKDLTDVLQTAPGIMITNGVNLYGKQISNIYIDRRKVKVDNNNLLSYLNTYKGGDIEKIEVISDPDISERYGGTALKITTKKHTGGFVSASVAAMGNKNRFAIDPMANLDYRREKFSLYASFMSATINSNSKETITNNWKESEKQVVNIIKEKTKQPYTVKGIMGVGYDISENDYISADVSYWKITRTQNRKTKVESTDKSLLPGGSFRDYETVNTQPSVSIMYVHKFKDASELTVTGDYVGAYNSDDITTGSFDIESDEKKDENLTKTENNTNSFVGYANYSKRFKRIYSINTGMQYSYIKNEAVNNESSFVYNESELRYFASYSANFNKFGFRGGAQIKWANIDDNNYLDFVPNVSLRYYINQKKGHILSANYSRTVSRPTIFQLNPNTYLSDRDIYVRVGNPNLTSYYTNNYNLSLQLFNQINLSAGYSNADDAITSYMYSDDEGTVYMTYTNEAVSKGANLSLNYNNYLFNMLSLGLSASYNFSEFSVKGKSNIVNSMSYNIMLSLALPKFYSIRMWAFGSTAKRVSYNATRKDPLLVNLAFSKRIKRWNIGFNITDLLDSQKRGDTNLDMGDYVQTVHNGASFRGYQLNISYNFSWGTAKRARKADTQKGNITGRIGLN